MIRVNVFVEGQTEETFLRELLVPYFSPANIHLNAILVRTSSRGKGGIVNYAKIRPQLHNKCTEDRGSYVSTMFDLFRLPNDFPGGGEAAKISDPLQRACHLEKCMEQDLQHGNFFANLIVHEFEGLLYSEPNCFSGWFDGNAVQTLCKEREGFLSPEHINDGPETAPSKRVLRACSKYEKPLHGALIALSIGLDRIRAECRHFDSWLTRIAGLGQGK